MVVPVSNLSIQDVEATDHGSILRSCLKLNFHVCVKLGTVLNFALAAVCEENQA